MNQLARNNSDGDQWELAKGNTLRRLFGLPFLMLAWFAPHKTIRVFFHKLRGVRIGKGVEIGYFCIIGNVHPEMVEIEDEAVITARVTILEHDNSYFYTGRGDVKFGEVRIGRRAFVGIGSVIMPGVSIGERAIVGSLTFVNRNVVAESIVVGNPGRALEL